MRRIQIAIVTLGLLAGLAPVASALNRPRTNGTCQKSGQGKGKKLGPQDGSGPQHTPGTGGGNGAGQQRRGRR